MDAKRGLALCADIWLPVFPFAFDERWYWLESSSIGHRATGPKYWIFRCWNGD